MAIRPSLNIAVPKRKNKASEYNENFELMMDFIDDSIQESKDYVDGYMPAISSSTKNKFLTNNGSVASWNSLGNQPFGGFIEGLILSKSSDDTLNISAGSCYDITKTIILSLATATTKQNESQSANSTYYVYIIGNGSSIDFLITTSLSEPTLPTGYIYYRQIGYYKTDNDNKISAIYVFGTNSTAPRPYASIIETYINGTSWYRVYSDGWCEQGGWTESANSYLPVTFLKPFANNDYTITGSLVTTNSTAYDAAIYCQYVTITSKSTTGITLFVNTSLHSSLGRRSWAAYGYIE